MIVYAPARVQYGTRTILLCYVSIRSITRTDMLEYTVLESTGRTTLTQLTASSVRPWLCCGLSCCTCNAMCLGRRRLRRRERGRASVSPTLSTYCTPLSSLFLSCVVVIAAAYVPTKVNEDIVVASEKGRRNGSWSRALPARGLKR